jgi:hypothetical protein
VGPRAGLGAVAKRKNLSPCREWNPGRPAPNQVTFQSDTKLKTASKSYDSYLKRYETNSSTYNKVKLQTFLILALDEGYYSGALSERDIATG